jgi:hypothetical protein
VPHALDQDVWAFDARKAQQFARGTAFFQAFESCANNLIRCVAISPTKYADMCDVAPTLQEVWPTCSEELPKFLLLQKRSARYRIVRDAAGAAEGKTNWELGSTLGQDLGSAAYTTLAMQLLRKKHDAFLRELRARRADEAAEQQWSRALKTARAASMDAFLAQLSLVRDGSSHEHKLLWKALKQLGSTDKKPELYEDKLEVLITGRVKTRDEEYEVVFNRGNLHPHPEQLAPMSAAFQARLRALRRQHDWPIRHTYRDGKANRNGHSNEKPSAWAKKRSTAAKTFWEDQD